MKASWVKQDILWRISGTQASAGDIKGALQTTASMENGGHRNFALGDIALTQAKAGDIKGALRTAATIQSEGSNSRSRTLFEITEAQVKAGNTPGALKTVAALQDEADRDSALWGMASAQIKVGDIQGALATADRIRDKNEQAYALHEIAVAQHEMGDEEVALRTIAKIQDGTYDHDSAVLDIVRRYIKSGNLRRARQIANLIRSDIYWKTDALLEIAQTQSEAGDRKGALAWVRELRSPLEKTYGLLGVAYGMGSSAPAGSTQK